ncbi:MAG TPA: phosphopantetheine-containing protein [Lachnospiraceae bacterium]|nr:acyl carrier protein [Clostridium sp. AF36-4]HCI65928.1 phosphopantetheine-containing protein [Lachnospiraceae bacterium]
MYSVVMQIKIDQVKEDNTVSLEEKLDLLEEIMDYEDSLGVDMVLSDLEEWDSLSTLALAAKVKELYGENLTNDEIQNFKTVKDICDYLK